MKHQILTLAFFLTSFFFLGITMTTFAQQNDSTTIKITLPEAKDTENAEVNLIYNHPVFYELVKKFQFTPIENNKFEYILKFAISKPQEYHISANSEWDFSLLIFPNDEIEIVLYKGNEAKFVKGKTVKENQSTYDWKKEILYRNEDFVTFEWQEAIQKMDSLTNAYLSNYEKVFEGSKPNPIFDTYFRTELKLTHIYIYNQYPFSRNRYLGEKSYDKNIYKEYRKSIPTLETDLNADYPYTNSYLNYISYNSLGEECVYEEGSSRTEFIKCQYEGLQKLTSKNKELQKTLSFTSANNTIQSIKMAGVIGIDAKEEKKLAAFLDTFLEELNKKYPNTEEVIFLEKQIKLLRKIATGSNAPAFSLKNKDGKTVSLSDLKGKYILIDFWATWCQPCIREIPFSKELEEEFSDDVTFVYVCMASKEDKWKEMVAEKGLKGLQLFTEGEQEKQMADDYQVSFFPTYILLDREGKIITKNIRPSNNGREVLKEIIEAEK